MLHFLGTNEAEAVEEDARRYEVLIRPIELACNQSTCASNVQATSPPAYSET